MTEIVTLTMNPDINLTSAWTTACRGGSAGSPPAVRAVMAPGNGRGRRAERLFDEMTTRVG